MFRIKNHIVFVLIISQLTIYCTISFAQRHAIGLTVDYNAGTFLNFSKRPDYNTNYQLKSGCSVASFYETKIDSIVNIRVELQYRLQNAGMEIYRNAGHASLYKNLDYSLHSLNLNLIYLFRIVDRKSFKANILLGPVFSYNTKILARGNGWDYQQVTQVDSLGNLVSVLTTENWEKNERNSKDLSMFNAGVNLGLEFIIPVRDQLDFLIQNRYTILITKVSNLHTPLFIGSLQVGLRYSLKK